MKHTVSVYHIDRSTLNGAMYLITPDHNEALSRFKDKTTRLVAEVTHEAKDVEDILEYAFHMTNTIEETWYEQVTPQLKIHDVSRSTSVGDIMVVDNGEMFVVDTVGFSHLHPEV